MICDVDEALERMDTAYSELDQAWACLGVDGPYYEETCDLAEIMRRIQRLEDNLVTARDEFRTDGAPAGAGEMVA